MYRLIFLILTCLVKLASFFQFQSIDTQFLRSLFLQTQSSTNELVLNTLSFGTTNPKITIDPSNDPIITRTSYFEEQCMQDCLRRISCIGYLFDSQRTNCSLYLRSNFARQASYDPTVNAKLTSMLGCNLQSCSDALYCSSESGGRCLYDASHLNGVTFANKINYALSDWSSWSSCSTQCGQGFTKRSRTCYRVYLNSNNVEFKREALDNLEWMCDTAGNSNQKWDVKVCTAQNCVSDWTPWKSCSKICGGFTTRQRRCLVNADVNPLCDPSTDYLNQMQSCSNLNNCETTLVMLDNTETNPIPNIVKKGYLKLIETQKNVQTRLFTQTNDPSLMNIIGKLTCSEMGYSRFSNVNPVLVSSSLRTSMSSDQSYLNFVNNENLNGLVCSGSEPSIKACQVSNDAQLSTNLYELEVECIIDGNWSPWGSFGSCSVTCGMGAKTRYRYCNDTMPSVSAEGNGAYCPSTNLTFISCVMPRCDSPRDSTSATLVL